MKNPATSKALTEVRHMANLIPTAQPVFEHLCGRLQTMGKCPAFFAEARDYLTTQQAAATRNGQQMLSDMLGTTAKAMTKRAAA